VGWGGGEAGRGESKRNPREGKDRRGLCGVSNLSLAYHKGVGVRWGGVGGIGEVGEI